MDVMKLPEARELYLRILMVRAKASVTIEWAGQPGLGWFSEMKELLLRGIQEAPECRKWGTRDRNEGAGGIATLNRDIFFKKVNSVSFLNT